MAQTRFTGPVVSDNGFVGSITLTDIVGDTLEVSGTSTLTGAVSAPGGVTGNLTGTASAVNGSVTATTLVLPTSTSAALGAIANAINTAGKVANKAVYNTTTKTIYVAQGSTAGATWIDTADGTTTITPA